MKKAKQQTPKKYWFRAKHYGWGWYPSSWQGWLILGIFMSYLIARSIEMKNTSEPLTPTLHSYIIEIVIPVILLIIICYLTGEKPGWRWGNKKK